MMDELPENVGFKFTYIRKAEQSAEDLINELNKEKQ